MSDTSVVIDKKVLESQIRQIYADAMWNHRTQEEQADIYIRRYNFLEATKVMLSTLTTSGIAGSIFLSQNIIKYITAAISLATLLVTSYTKTYNLNDLYKQYKDKSIEFLDLREKLLNLLYSIKLDNIDIQEIMKDRDDIFAQLRDAHNSANEVSKTVIKLVEKELKITEDNVYSDEQIDNILPSLLRVSTQNINSNVLTSTVPQNIK